jgi:hypothetical protein
MDTLAQMSARTFTTTELSRETGVPVSTLKKWVQRGYVTPAIHSLGRGDAYAFTEDNAAQVRALTQITRDFGDGALARAVIERAVPQVRAGVRHCVLRVATVLAV